MIRNTNLGTDFVEERIEIVGRSLVEVARKASGTIVVRSHCSCWNDGVTKMTCVQKIVDDEITVENTKPQLGRNEKSGLKSGK